MKLMRNGKSRIIGLELHRSVLGRMSRRAEMSFMKLNGKSRSNIDLAKRNFQLPDRHSFAIKKVVLAPNGAKGARYGG